MRDLAQVTEGSIIPTGIPKDARVIVRAGSQERFIGHPGRVNGNLAVRIVDALPLLRLESLTSLSMNTAEIDALVASAQAAKKPPASRSPRSSTTGPPPLPLPPPCAGTDARRLRTDDAREPEVPIGMLLDLTLPVSIELGRTSMMVQEILRLGRGSVIQLDRLAGEPIDIYVGDRRFAEGEVVVLGEHFGVRITRVLANPGAAGAANAA
jgi:flagellar motor switch protein FliN